MNKTRVYVGFGLHVLVAAVIVFSAAIKLFGCSSLPERFQAYVVPLAIAELVNAAVLLIPRTMSFGILLTSACWGAVIALTFVEFNSQTARMHPLVPTAFLIMTWVGGYLRDPRMLYSFGGGARPEA
jgi:hypothetical protein